MKFFKSLKGTIKIIIGIVPDDGNDVFFNIAIQCWNNCRIYNKKIQINIEQINILKKLNNNYAKISPTFVVR